MKKVFVLFLTAGMFAFASCGGASEVKENVDEVVDSAASVEDEVTEGVEEVTEEVVDSAEAVVEEVVDSAEAVVEETKTTEEEAK